MENEMASVVIPARLASSRLPRKVLLDLGGKPVIQHVWERVKKMKLAREIFIATDSPEVVEAARAFGAQARLTSPNCRNGTERLVELLPELKGEFLLNVQGDEPFVSPELLDTLVRRWQETRCDLVTAVYALKESEALFNPNVVKVVRAQNGRALYFSRSPIPHLRGVDPKEWLQKRTYYGHLGIYGYTRKVLSQYLSLPSSDLEKAESLEQLRFLERDLAFQTVLTDYRAVAIDTLADLEHARGLLS